MSKAKLIAAGTVPPADSLDKSPAAEGRGSGEPLARSASDPPKADSPAVSPFSGVEASDFTKHAAQTIRSLRDSEGANDTGPANGLAEVVRIEIEIPLARIPARGYQASRQTHIDVKLFDIRQEAAMRHIFFGLDASDARLENGKRVTTKPDVVRWLMQRVVEAIEAEGSDFSELLPPQRLRR